MEQVIITYNNRSQVEKFGISLKEIFLTVDLAQVAVVTYLGLDYTTKDFLIKFEVPVIASFKIVKDSDMSELSKTTNQILLETLIIIFVVIAVFILTLVITSLLFK
jgi:hypothetical protein